MAFRIWLSIACALALATGYSVIGVEAGTHAAGTQAASVWDGVFSAAQQKRGDALYVTECSTCHGETLKGGEGAPALVGADFIARWSQGTLADLFDKVSQTMPAPPEQPGKLSPQQNADVVAFMLSASGFPAGAGDLPTTSDALARIRITAKR
jgi:S-disulfanyl-L-cysteine oxidoreductase SoxD